MHAGEDAVADALRSLTTQDGEPKWIKNGFGQQRKKLAAAARGLLHHSKLGAMGECEVHSCVASGQLELLHLDAVHSSMPSSGALGHHCIHMVYSMSGLLTKHWAPLYAFACCRRYTWVL
jgi:hypothetical protein